MYPKIFYKCRTILIIFAMPRIFKKRLLMEHYWKEAYYFTCFFLELTPTHNSLLCIGKGLHLHYKEKKY
jgi:hypothetical protein